MKQRQGLLPVFEGAAGELADHEVVAPDRAFLQISPMERRINQFSQ